MAKILFIDDDDLSGEIEYLKDKWKEAGHEIVFERVFSSTKGVEAVKRHCPDVVMCDGIIGGDNEAGAWIVSDLKRYKKFMGVIIAHTSADIGVPLRVLKGHAAREGLAVIAEALATIPAPGTWHDGHGNTVSEGENE